jgi:DNA-binding SARP family transcriptional activator
VTTLRLETFGGLSLSGAEGPGQLSQRRRLALLALLAVARDRGMQRDKLLGYLWPESTADGARHSLEQLVYGLRRELGESLFIGTNPLVLNANALTSDVAEFETAIESGRLTDAVRLYRGPFLDGFYISGLSELEEWTSGERRRLADAYASALEKLAEEARARSDFASAVDLWRKHAASDNLSARGALGLMRALADSGDRAGALQHARLYELLVTQQLQSSLDPDVATFAKELRNGSPLRKSPSPDPGTSVGDYVAGPPPRATIATRQKHKRLPALALSGALVVVLAFSIGWLSLRDRAKRNESQLDDNLVAVLPFRFAGSDSSHAYLAEGVMDLLAARLTGEGGPIAVDTRRAMTAWRERSSSPRGTGADDIAVQVARDVGAGEALTGDLLATKEGPLVFSGSLRDVATGRSLASASVAGPPDSLFTLLDHLAAQLLTQRAGADTRSIAALTTTSLPALRAFLEGRAAHRRGHITAAVRAFGRALDFDSTFAVAAVELAVATGRLFQWETFTIDTVRQTRPIGLGRGTPRTGDDDRQWRRALEIAWRERGRLNARDQALLKAVRGNFPRPTDALTVLRNWEGAVQAAPDRADVHNALGEILWYQGRPLGLIDAPVRAEASFRRAMHLDPAYVRPIGGLLEIAAFRRDTAAVRRLGALYLARDSISDEAAYVRWRVATIVGDSRARRQLQAQFDSLGVNALDPIQWVSQVDGIALDDGDRAMALILARSSENQERQIAFHRSKFLALNRGRPTAASRLIAAKREIEPNSDLKHEFEVRDAIWWDGDKRAGQEAAEALAARISNSSAQLAGPKGDSRVNTWRFTVSLWRIAHHDTTGVHEAINRLRNRPAPRGTDPPQFKTNVQAAMLAGLLAMEEKRSDSVTSALQLIDSTALTGCCTLPHFINLVSAQLHESQGDIRGALAAIRRGRWLYPPEHLSTYLREEGRLAALSGDRPGAMKAYRHYLVLRSNPEAALVSQVDSIRAALAALEGRRR